MASPDVVSQERQQPFALQLYEAFLGGKTVQQLADESGISVERIQLRIDAARLYYERHPSPAPHKTQIIN